eukprot:5262845-Prymnesium_polylepis.1
MHAKSDDDGERWRNLRVREEIDKRRDLQACECISSYLPHDEAQVCFRMARVYATLYDCPFALTAAVRC